MRNIKHHCIVVTAHDQKFIANLRVKLLELVKTNIEASNGSKMIGEATESLVNNYYTLVIFPDGSKEGHDTSDDADVFRKKIINYLISLKETVSPDIQLSFMECYYGTDDGKAEIINYG